MARAGTPLDVGDAFPALTMDTVDHGRLALPGTGDHRRTAVLVVRAHW